MSANVRLALGLVFCLAVLAVILCGPRLAIEAPK